MRVLKKNLNIIRSFYSKGANKDCQTEPKVDRTFYFLRFRF